MIDAVILDRDGTLIRDSGFIHKIEDVEFYSKVMDALRLLDKETEIIIITNQAGIAKGKFKKEDYFKLRDYIHKTFRENNIEISGEYFCPHHPKGIVPEYTKKCSCRKPLSELFEKAIKEHNLNPENCWTIGDMRRDIIAGQNVGMKGILVKTGFGGQGGHGDPVTPEYTAKDLYDAIRFILGEEEK